MILYKDIPHTYEEVSTGKIYKSATSFLAEFEKKQDWDTIAERYAKKHNKKVKKETGVDPETTGEYWRNVWNEAKDNAAKRGSLFHEKQEQKTLGLEGNIKVFPSTLDENKIKTSFDIKTLEDGLYPELIIWMNAIEVAGQADLVKIQDGYIHILDYKTNEKLSDTPHVRWDGSFDTFLPPINNVPVTKMHKYYLQLNLYMYMLRSHNPKLKIGKMIIRHIQFSETDIPIGWEDYMVPNMQEDIRRIVEKRANDLLFG